MATVYLGLQRNPAFRPNSPGLTLGLDARSDIDDSLSGSKTSVQTGSNRENRPLSMFLSYSHRDEKLREELEAHLALLRHEGHIKIWNDRMIKGGEQWVDKVSDHLESADIILLLVSPDFLNSDYCYKTEVRRALTRHESGTAQVVPIILRSCDWESAPFSKLQVWPRDGKPIVSSVDHDTAWAEVAKALRILCDNGRAGKNAPGLVPRFPNDRIRDWCRQLKAAYRRLEDLTLQGSDVVAQERKIADIRRHLRDGGLQAGDFLDRGRFQLIDEIGTGGFATVWKAYDRRRRTPVAVKILHAQYSRDSSRRGRFFRGAREMAKLHHPGVVRVIEEKKRDGRFHYFVMELVEEGELYSAVRDYQISDIGERLGLVLEVGQALTYAHKFGVIHRDVKPQNVLIDGRGRARLTDFDLVRTTDSSAGTRTGRMLGTVVYAAPEAMSNAKEAGVEADVFGLGMTAVFAVYGRDLPHEVLRDAAGFVDQLEVEGSVRKVLGQAVAWEVERRFESIEEFCKALEESLRCPVGKPAKQLRGGGVRRWRGNMNGERYLGNTNTKEVHDLDNEKTQCQIDEIIAAGHDRPFKTLQAAENAGFDRGAYCLGGSKL